MRMKEACVNKKYFVGVVSRADRMIINEYQMSETRRHTQKVYRDRTLSVYSTMKNKEEQEKIISSTPKMKISFSIKRLFIVLIESH